MISNPFIRDSQLSPATSVEVALPTATTAGVTGEVTADTLPATLVTTGVRTDTTGELAFTTAPVSGSVTGVTTAVTGEVALETAPTSSAFHDKNSQLVPKQDWSY